jgi:hypothetical protein
MTSYRIPAYNFYCSISQFNLLDGLPYLNYLFALQFLYDFPLLSSSPHLPEIQAIALPLVHDASGSIVIPVPLRQMGLPPNRTAALL